MKLLFIYLIPMLGVIFCEAQFNSGSGKNRVDAWTNIQDKYQNEGIYNQFLDHCREIGGETAYNSYKFAEEHFPVCCTEAGMNLNEIASEYQQSKENGDMKNFFKKYCRKETQLKQCLSDYFNGITPCLTQDEEQIKTSLLKISYALGDFICYNEGSRSAAFIDDGGPECIFENYDLIFVCMKSSLAPYITMVERNLDAIKYLFDKPQCLSFAQFQECSIEAVKICSKPTITDFVDDAFSVTKKSSPCEKYYSGNGSEGSRKSLYQRTLTISIAFILTLFFLL